MPAAASPESSAPTTRALSLPGLLGVLLLALLFLHATPPAVAGDARVVDLPLQAGGTIRGAVESADEKEVVVRVGPEEVRRVPWAQLAPLGFYRASAALAPAADGDARVALAELAADLGLYAEVRAEYEKALALGAVDRKQYEEVVTDAERRAVVQGVEHARRVAEAGDIEAAMEVARTLKLDFATAPNASAVDELIGDLLKRVKEFDAEAAKAAAELDRAQAELARNKEVLRRLTHAAKVEEEAATFAAAAAEARKIGNVTRAGKNAEEADERYMEARRDLGRLRRILPRESDQRKEVLTRLTQLDRAQFALLFATAKFFYDQRIWSKAEEWANRAAYLDPVHPDLLEIREGLRERRIRIRFSSITNARPIVR